MATAPKPLASHPTFPAELQELEHLIDALEEAAEKQLAVIERLSAKPGRQCLGLLNHELAVEHEELLHRNGRDYATLARQIRIGKIE